MFSSESFLVTPEDLRHHGRRTIDWVADYLAGHGVASRQIFKSIIGRRIGVQRLTDLG